VVTYITKAPHIPRVHEMLGELRAKDGILAIRGNHDFWTQPGAVAKELEQIGARVLSNECAAISRGDGELRIVGIEAPYIPLSDREMVVLITEGRPHLALGAHTGRVSSRGKTRSRRGAPPGTRMGGRSGSPFFGTTLSSTTMGAGYAYGSNRLGRMLCITSAGVGSFVPLRLCCPPEMILLHLTR
jgi:predicted MPP superfamily phosphohydrolase